MVKKEEHNKGIDQKCEHRTRTMEINHNQVVSDLNNKRKGIFTLKKAVVRMKLKKKRGVKKGNMNFGSTKKRKGG